MVAPPLRARWADPDDAAFAELAAAVGAPLVTGNAGHFVDARAFGVVVMTPREAVNRLARDPKT